MATVTERKKQSFSKKKASPPNKKGGGGLWFVLMFVTVFLLILCAVFPWEILQRIPVPVSTEEKREILIPSWIDPQILQIDGASRRGEKLDTVRNIAVHYVGNPGTSAMANRNWFASPESDTSSHFIVGLEGEVIQCIPLEEKSSATNERNRDTISVEVCHPEESGKFSDVTRDSLVRLLAWLCGEFDLTEEEIIRHYDVTGKMCPLYYVENEDEWLRLKADVKKALKGEAYGEND